MKTILALLTLALSSTASAHDLRLQFGVGLAEQRNARTCYSSGAACTVPSAPSVDPGPSGPVGPPGPAGPVGPKGDTAYDCGGSSVLVSPTIGALYDVYLRKDVSLSVGGYFWLLGSQVFEPTALATWRFFPKHSALEPRLFAGASYYDGVKARLGVGAMLPRDSRTGIGVDLAVDVGEHPAAMVLIGLEMLPEYLRGR